MTEIFTSSQQRRWETRIAELEDALIWCSGSTDFNEGGQAREGWLRVCAPLLTLEGTGNGAKRLFLEGMTTERQQCTKDICNYCAGDGEPVHGREQ